MMLWLLLALNIHFISSVKIQQVTTISVWWPPSKIAESFMVPDYASSTNYDYVALGTWNSRYGPVNILPVWAHPQKSFGTSSEFGSSKDQIQKYLKKKYNDNGKKIIVMAFDKDDIPASSNTNAKSKAQQLADFVKNNNLDGVLINFSDEYANPPKKSQWLSTFESQLKNKLSGKIIVDTKGQQIIASAKVNTETNVKKNPTTSVQPMKKVQPPKPVVPMKPVSPSQTGDRIVRPIYMAYVNTIPSYSSAKNIASGIGVPGFAPPSSYNYFTLSFWLTTGPVDMVGVWANPTRYFSPLFGSEKNAIQKALKKNYNDAGQKILLSAFGATEFPTSIVGIGANDCATRLGNFILENNVDGVDVDWQDNGAMNAGTGEQWLVDFSIKLRQILPNHLIAHAPQAPYFRKQHYRNGAYMTVHEKVGDTIDMYCVQFYNQGSTSYDSYEKLFTKSGGYFPGTSVKEIIDRGVPMQKVVVGKPAKTKDVVNTGYVDSVSLGNWGIRAKSQFGWNTGFMFWQYSSDLNGDILSNAIHGNK